MNPNRVAFANQQLLMEQTDGPLSIRQLAEQSFSMREMNKKENFKSRQHNSVLYKRSVDPVISQNRRRTPLDGSIMRMTKDGLIGVEDQRAPVRLNNEGGGDDEQQQQQQPSGETSSTPNGGGAPKNHAVIWIGVGIAVAFMAILAMINASASS
jgi:hypothetical protein